MRNEIRSKNVATVLNEQYDTHIQLRDVHQIMQINKKHAQSLSDAKLFNFKSQRLLSEVTKQNDRYRIKFKSDTKVMNCIFY